MADRLQQILLSSVAVMVIAAGCNDGADGDVRPEDQIAATEVALWQAIGLDRAQVSVGGYRYRSLADSRSCIEFIADEEDRWVGSRSSSSAPGLVTQTEAETALTTALAEMGLDVRHYRGTHPDDTIRGIDAISEELRVYGYLSSDGHTDITVVAGPCAPTFGGFGDTFVLDD